MTPAEKLQVFVSSTYEDLRAERQAAVEATLTVGHIPAGMELFTAGDQSQMEVIQRWIDESDVFLLILGGRYGTIEPKSQKSYIQIEYEYACLKDKSLFAVVITEDGIDRKVKKLKRKAIEQEHPDQLKSFRDIVRTKIVREWTDIKDIKLAIVEKLSELNKREDLIGWIPGSQAVNSGALVEEMARLTKENATLRDRVLKMEGETTTYHGLSFERMLQCSEGKNRLRRVFLTM